MPQMTRFPVQNTFSCFRTLFYSLGASFPVLGFGGATNRDMPLSEMCFCSQLYGTLCTPKHLRTRPCLQVLCRKIRLQKEPTTRLYQKEYILCEFEGGIQYAHHILKTCISRGSQGNQRPTPFAPWIDTDQSWRKQGAEGSPKSKNRPVIPIFFQTKLSGQN